MANWNKEMVTPEQINGGNEFTPNDNLSVTELNAIVNNSFFSAETAQEAKEIAETAKEASDNFVSYATQTPTDAQKQQARENIGAVAKATNPINNNLVSLDAEGNIKDSGTNVFKLKNKYAQFNLSTDYTPATVTAWVNIKMPFILESQSANNRFSVSNGTITYNGEEEIKCLVTFQPHLSCSNTSEGVLSSFIYKNGTNVFSAPHNAGAIWELTTSCSYILTLNKNDNISASCSMSNNTSNSRTFKANTTLSIMEIE